MRILITGNLGYIGPVLSKFIKENFNNSKIVGYDTGYFKSNKMVKNFKNYIDKQIIGDIRNFKIEYLNKIDAVIHLCAISNDPIGNKFEEVTHQVNYQASKKLLNMVIRSDIEHFSFASSCSVYGRGGKLIKNENDKIKPLTAYAKSKIDFEKLIKKISKKTNARYFTSLRFPTACGMSPMLRLDLVLNDFVCSAINEKKIVLLSDGKAWRPLIDVKDMSRAMLWSILRKGEKNLSINTGSNKNNFLIKELAEKVQKLLPGKIDLEINEKNKSDKRSYKVDFSKFNKISGDFKSTIPIEKTILELYSNIKKSKRNFSNFRQSTFMRLVSLEKLILKNKINKNLIWKK